MTLTLAHGPLSQALPNTVNYRIDGPAHRLLFEDFPRRVRAVFGGQTVLAHFSLSTGHQYYRELETLIQEPVEARTRGSLE